MNHGIYIAAAGMQSRTQALDVAANNIANLGTAGYKRDTVFYNIFNRVNGSQLERALSDSVVVDQVKTNFSPGPLIRTNSPLNLAVAGDGMFTVQTPQGVRYTRNGEFTLNSRREIVTPQGFQVLGQNGPIQVPEGNVEVGSLGDVSVEGVLAGRLKLVHFADPAQLLKSGNTYFEAAPGAVGTPPPNLSVKQGFLEGSNVNPVSGLASALHNMRHYQMLARAIRSLSQEVDRKVIDEVGRV